MIADKMSQEEIDALLGGGSTASDSEAEEEAKPQAPPFEPGNSESSAVELDDLERDTLAEIGNISMGSAATALSTVVNRRVNITVPDVHLSTLRDVMNTYPVPCIVVDVEYIEGLQGTNVLVIQEHDALVIGSLMMGEDGTDPPDELDEMYLSAVTEAMNMMMGATATAMSDLFNYRIDISPPHASQKHLAETPPDEEQGLDDPVVVVAFRIEINSLVDSTMVLLIEPGFAKAMVAQLMTPASEDDMSSEQEEQVQAPPADEVDDSESVHDWDQLRSESAPIQGQAEQAASAQAHASESEPEFENINVDLIRDIPVQVRAVLGRARMPIDKILSLGPGYIMELDALEGEPIEVYANDTLIARGEVVVVDEQFGIRITDISTQRNRINSIRS